jgi:hypothetical protein
MLSKELEILKLIEELYHGDISDEEFLQACQEKQAKIQAWKEAFEGYPLFEVTKAINHFYTKKSSKTRPNIAQLTAILQENGATKEYVHTEEIKPTYGIIFQQQDKENGDMHWFVPDYLKVEQLIRRDYWGWVHNIYKPTIEEFHRCMEEWCEETTGHKYRFYSDNDIKNMTSEQVRALEQRCHEMADNFLKKLN